MLSVGPGTRILMSVEPIDLRRGHDGLVTLVRERYRADPYSGELYMFFGRRRDRVKILFFSAGGFVLYYKRLERGRFTMPEVPVGADRFVVDAATLAMLLDGVDIRSIKRTPQWEPRKKK
ncbi:MAG: IS66 family insertion sequence element accessory protein TnpB [Polyangiales bacterium]